VHSHGPVLPWVHLSPNPKRHLSGSAVLYSSRQRVPIIYNQPPFPHQNCLFPWGSGTPFNRPTWLFGPTQFLDPNGISIGLAVFARSTIVTDRQTDRQRDHVHATRSLTTGCIDVTSGQMILMTGRITGEIFHWENLM